MVKHYIKVALRLIKRSFLFSTINMLGFVFGMTAYFQSDRSESGDKWRDKGIS